jgi:hypothetical protein
MNPDQRFRKYQWIEVDVAKASDPRPESHTLNIDSVQIVGNMPPDGGPWSDRRRLVERLQAHCLCCLVKERDGMGYPTLGFFKPAKIEKLIIRPAAEDWTPEEYARLRQYTLFESMPAEELEKIPYTFYYRFWCPEPHCKSHTLSCTDWEMAQSWRSWRTRYGDGWEEKFRETYERDMIHVHDTHFYVGTVHGHPNRWIIVGLFYPNAEKVPAGVQGQLL